MVAQHIAQLFKVKYYHGCGEQQKQDQEQLPRFAGCLPEAHIDEQSLRALAIQSETCTMACNLEQADTMRWKNNVLLRHAQPLAFALQLVDAAYLFQRLCQRRLCRLPFPVSIRCKSSCGCS